MPDVFVANRLVCGRSCYHVLALARRARDGKVVAGVNRAANFFRRRSGCTAIAR
jgi:hypothetical protein